MALSLVLWHGCPRLPWAGRVPEAALLGVASVGGRGHPAEAGGPRRRHCPGTLLQFSNYVSQLLFLLGVRSQRRASKISDK